MKDIINHTIYKAFNKSIYFVCVGNFSTQFIDWLSLRERRYFEKNLKNRRKKNDWLLGRVAVKELVLKSIISEKYPKLSPCDIDVKNNTHGEPRIEWSLPLPPPRISISHRDGTAIAAISLENQIVGCDIEINKSRAEGFSTHFLNEKENSLWIEKDKGYYDFPTITTALWGAKESAIKSIKSFQGNEDLNFFDLNILPLNHTPELFHFTYKELIGKGMWIRYGKFIISIVYIESEKG